MSDFDNSGLIIGGRPALVVQFDGKHFVNPTQALVIGSLIFVKIGDNEIMPYSDTYNFDLKLQQGTFMRDVFTGIGLYVAGYGTPYKIHFYNWGTIPD